MVLVSSYQDPICEGGVNQHFRHKFSFFFFFSLWPVFLFFFFYSFCCGFSSSGFSLAFFNTIWTRILFLINHNECSAFLFRSLWWVFNLLLDFLSLSLFFALFLSYWINVLLCFFPNTGNATALFLFLSPTYAAQRKSSISLYFFSHFLGIFLSFLCVCVFQNFLDGFPIDPK